MLTRELAIGRPRSWRRRYALGKGHTDRCAPPMPQYSTMTDEETQAIYVYLQSVPKLKNVVSAR